ncbi:MAG: malonyl-CoA decarboxylase [Hyphomicrobiales bacterium]
MSNNSSIYGMLSSVFERAIVFSKSDDKRSITELCDALLSGRGEATGTKIAHALFNKYETLSHEDKQEFFLHLNENLDVSPDEAEAAAADYAKNMSAEALKNLRKICEPKRLELLRRLNSAPGGTERLVRMREDLLGMLNDIGRLKRTDVDFEYLFSSWFNRGFLVLRPIDWTTPAHILEKVISYEAVHEISSWDDLRRRLLPADRRCYAFFHPAMPDEPLIFVEIALTNEIARSVQKVLAEGRDEIEAEEATAAIFYSISNCQKGLQGVSFGNFLIKQVASDLAYDLPNLKTFVTLSPVPAFTRWLAKASKEEPDGKAHEALGAVLGIEDGEGLERITSLQGSLTELLAHYFLNEKRPDGLPFDPVARFHLGNGASLLQINWAGDVSAKGLKQSAGLMVNYHYNLKDVEANHEAYAQDRVVVAHKSVKALADKARLG